MTRRRIFAQVAMLLPALTASMAMSAPPRPSIAERLQRSAPKPRPTQRPANALPTSFDIYPSDPCAGMWTVHGHDKAGFGKIIVGRIAGEPFVHLDWGEIQQNFHPDALGPHGIEMREGASSLTMHCSPDLALIDLFYPDGDQVQHMALEATQ